MASYAGAGTPRRQESLTRADILRGLAFAGLSVGVAADVLGACSSATFEPSGSTLPPTPTPSPTGAVALLAPSDAIDPAVLRAFSQRTGVAVRAAAPADGATLPEALSGDASYDVLLAPDRVVAALARRRLLRPLDMTLLNNFDYVQGAFRAPPYDHGDPARYSVPYQFSTLGFTVWRDEATAAPRGWADLWQPRFKRAVRFTVRGRSVIGIGLLSLGLRLGSRDRREVATAAKRLIGLTPNLLLTRPAGMGKAPVTVCWSPRAVRDRRAGSTSGPRYVLPVDGFEIATDALCVPLSAANRLAAHVFLDFCLRPGVQRRLSLVLGTQSAEPEAWRYLPALERSFAHEDLQLAHGQWLGDLGSFGVVYDQAWETVARAWGVAA
jgi:spermidine/putrescine transport system substrate-binding protein